MKRLLTTISALVLTAGVTTFLVTADAAIQDSFWADAAMGNMMEIAAANAALERSQNEQVKQYAQQMVTDHTAMGTELQALATSKNVTLPSAMDAKHKSDIDKLGAKGGADFDRDFMKMMVSDHQRMARMLEREAGRNADADVKAFAAKNLPIVQGHLSTARALNDTLRGSGRANASRDSNSNGNSTREANSNRRDNSNDNSSSAIGYSNKRPNVAPNANTNSNSNSNRNTNRNTNSNGNSNNSNVNRP